MGQMDMPRRTEIHSKNATHQATVKQNFRTIRLGGDVGISADMLALRGKTVYLNPDRRRGVWFDGRWYWHDFWLEDLIPIQVENEKSFYQYEEE